MQNYFRAIPGFGKVEVDQRSVDGYSYESVWIISYKDVFQPIPILTINDATLSGGKTEAKVTHRVLRNFSTNVIFDPIDYRHLRTSAPKPSVNVKVN